MAFKSYGNVWSNINRDIGSSFANDGRRASFSQNGFRDFGNFLVDPRKSRSPAGSGLSSGPFGSKMNYGSRFLFIILVLNNLTGTNYVI